MSKLSEYKKTLFAIIAGAIGWGVQVTTSEPAAITSTEWIALATAGATAIGVYALKNDSPDGQG